MKLGEPLRNDISRLNLKDETAINYDFCAGDKDIPPKCVITVKDFVSKTNFKKWKAESDHLDYEIYSSNHRFYDHNVASLDETITPAGPSCEELVIEGVEHQEKDALLWRVVRYLMSDLSPTMRRRFLLYYKVGLSEEEIAEMEGVAQQNVSKSIVKAREKIFERKCKLFMNKGCKNVDFSVFSESDYCEAFLHLKNRIHSVKGTKPAWPRGQRHKERRQDGI